MSIESLADLPVKSNDNVTERGFVDIPKTVCYTLLGGLSDNRAVPSLSGRFEPSYSQCAPIETQRQ
jgi:hypothetical protein